MKKSIYLFNQENPQGLMLNLTQEEIDEHLEDGWQDSPEGLTLPEEDTGLSQEDIESARPEDMVKLVESYGFIVLTPEQLKAEAEKMASVVLEIDKFDDEALFAEVKKRIGEEGFVALNLEEVNDESILAEAKRRGLKQSELVAEELNTLAEQFLNDPKSLNKDELVALGNNGYTLGLRSNMKEETLIAKIQEAMDSSE